MSGLLVYTLETASGQKKIEKCIYFLIVYYNHQSEKMKSSLTSVEQKVVNYIIS